MGFFPSQVGDFVQVPSDIPFTLVTDDTVPYDVVSNTSVIYANTSPLPFTFQMPGHQSNPNPVVSGDEVWLGDFGVATMPTGLPPANVIEASDPGVFTGAPGQNVLLPFWGDVGAAAGPGQSFQILGGAVAYKAFDATAAGLPAIVWLPLSFNGLARPTLDLGPFTGPGPHTIVPWHNHLLDGSSAFTVFFPPTPAVGEEVWVTEFLGSGVGTIVFDGSGALVVDPLVGGISPAFPMTAKPSFSMRWRFDGTGTWRLIWAVNT